MLRKGKIMRRALLVILVMFIFGTSYAQVPLVGSNSSLTLKDIEGSHTKVTIVFNKGDAIIPNVVITGLFPEHFGVQKEDESVNFYTYSSVKEIRVQQGVVEVKETSDELKRVLTKEDQEIVNRAWNRVREIFNTSYANQQLKIEAAILLAQNKEGGTEDVVQYLGQLSESNDLATALQAAFSLYLIGETDIDNTLLMAGLDSGNPYLKKLAINLVGLLGASNLEYKIEKLLPLRSPDKSAPAARTLALLGNRQIESKMFEMLLERNAIRSEAAVYALSKIGDEATIKHLKDILETVQGEAVFRIARVLSNLGASEGQDLLSGQCMETATFAPFAAIILSKKGDRRAMDFLRERLLQTYDSNKPSLIYRALAAAALVEGGNWSSITDLQNILRLSESDIQVPVAERTAVLQEVKGKTCQLIGDLNSRKLLLILESSIVNPDPIVSLAACRATISIAIPDYGLRLRKSRTEEPWSTAYMLKSRVVSKE